MLERHTKIVINGKEYRSLDEVPARLRPLLQGQIEEAMKNPGKTITNEKKFEIPLDQFSAKEVDEMFRSAQGRPVRNFNFGFEIQPKGGGKSLSLLGVLGWIVAVIAIAAVFYLL